MATDTVDAEALYVRDGDRYVPTILTQGPWDPTTQHGGAVCALLAAASECVEPPSPMRPARFTVDLLRPVPLAPTTAEVDVVREGNRIQLLDIRLRWGVKLVARASVLRVGDDKVIDADETMNARAAGPPPPGPDHPQRSALVEGPDGEWEPPGFIRAVEYRRVQGTHGSGVPATAWSRLMVPVVVGVANSPFTRLAAIVDFTSGTANYMDFMAYVMPNADVSVHLLRPMQGEWLGIDGACMVAEDGIAVSEATLWDEDGRVGTSSAALVVDRRSRPLG
ncbi:MAG: thioesterase family protein [Acidimicrobiia bacterium]|nr:thioesterase family protein [Acidimicrobiia bacterium]